MKRFTHFLALVLLPALLSAQHARQEMPFDRYDFVRTAYKADEIGYLLGNAEMGGIADATGLGFEKLWFTDLWESDRARRPLTPLRLSCEQLTGRRLSDAAFSNRYRLKDGMYKTRATFNDGFGYESTIYFSLAEKHRLVIQLKNIANKPVTWTLDLPAKDFDLHSGGHLILAQGNQDDAYTRSAWALHASQMLKADESGYSLTLAPQTELLLTFALTTHFDGEDYKQQAAEAVKTTMSAAQIEANHTAAWDAHWRSMASIILPDSHYAKWFYRALRGIYNTAGAEHFLAAELQFAVPDVDWKMHSFTYGHGGGWPIWVFAQLGDHKRAMNMIKATYKPEALHKNVSILFPEGPVDLVYRGQDKGRHTYIDSYNSDAIAFGHEVTTEGYNIAFPGDKKWDWQRHVDGYAAAFFHLMDRLYPSEKFTEAYSYPVLKGTAELWRSLVKWDKQRQIYFLPPLLSVSEDIMEKSVLDAVLSARWNLRMAAQYAHRLGLDRDLAEKWLEIYNKLYVPQNDEIYLEYLDDAQNRTGGGYFGIRAFACFGFPYLEEIKNIEPDKARRALDLAWQRNNRGKGMISFISDWFALTEAYLGHGDKAYAISELTTHLLDPSETAMCEAFDYDEHGQLRRRINPYFFTGYDALVLVPMAMMLHAYDGVIKAFPAMPKAFGHAAFYGLRAEAGIEVSGEMVDGKVEWVEYKKDGRLLEAPSNATEVQIISQNGQITLKPIHQ